MRFANDNDRPIIVSPPLVPQTACLDERFEALQRDLLEMASAWLMVNTRGLSVDIARRVVNVELARLRAINAAIEDGI